MDTLRKAKVVRFKKPGSCIYVAASTDKEKVIPLIEKKSGVTDVEESNRTHWMVEHLEDDMFKLKSCFSSKYLAYNLITRSTEVLQRDKKEEDGNHYDWTWSVAQCQGGSSVVLTATVRYSMHPFLAHRYRFQYGETMCWKQDHVFIKGKNSMEGSFSEEWEVVDITKNDRTNNNRSNSLVFPWPQRNAMSTAAAAPAPAPAPAPAAGTFLVCNSGHNSNSSGSQQNGDVHVTPSTVICYGRTYIMYHYQP